MPKYERNLWSFLSEKSCSNFNVIERLNLAIDLCLEVKKVHEKGVTHRDTCRFRLANKGPVEPVFGNLWPKNGFFKNLFSKICLFLCAEQ